MFNGEYDYTLDDKGRMTAPAKFREQLGEECKLTIGLDGCLFLYPLPEWDKFMESLQKLPGTKEGRQLQRHFMAKAADVTFDKQGRFLIPQKLRAAANIVKDVVMVGVLSKVELWSKEKYEQNCCYDNMDDVAEHMAEFGLSF